MDLEEAITKRKSVRRYKDSPLTKDEINKLMWAGLNCPSAGNIHPIKILVTTDKETKDKLCVAGLNQACISQAPTVIVLLAELERITRRYHGRGLRYCYMEAGHIGQNISLMAVSLGLGCVMIGAFKDEAVKDVLKTKDEPIYIIPVGRT